MISIPLPFCLLNMLDWVDVATHHSDDVRDCECILRQARDAIRRCDCELAKAIIIGAGDAVWQNARCLNVLGVIAEARGDWELARRLWSRAARRDRSYQPPRQNLRRYFELFYWGRCRDSVAFGDEQKFQLRLSENQS